MLRSQQVLQGRYQLQQKLGHNAGRQTWLAEDLQTHPSEKVIVKLLAFGGEVQWDDLKLFEREARVLKHLNHPQIPKYRDYFAIDDRTLWFGLVHDYIPGLSLKELLVEGKRFNQSEVRHIAESVLNILIYLHELNPPLLHRDIKPSNIILSQDKQVYLVDFGAVQDRAVKEGVTFTVVGTYGYAPMEQFGGRAVPASDLYALGATLIHLLTGVPPADLPQEELRIEFRDRIQINPKFTQWIQTLTEPSLKRRFSTANQAIEALKKGELLKVSNAIQPLKTSTIMNNSGCGGLFDSSVSVPDEIKGWNWGAFFLPHIWSINNGVWIGLLAFVPYFGSFVAFVLAAKGNEWAWKSKKWRSIEHFQEHQKGWIKVGFWIGIPMVWLPTLWMILWFVR